MQYQGILVKVDFQPDKAETLCKMFSFELSPKNITQRSLENSQLR